MEAVLKLPSDLPQLPQFRALQRALGDEPCRALWLWYGLFQELKYRQDEGGRCGLLPGAEVASVLSSLGVDRDFFDRVMVGLSRLLVAEGVDFVCPRYVLLHASCAPGGRSREQMGGDMRAFRSRQAGVTERAMQVTLALPGERFVDAEGVALDSDTVRRVTRLVICCDNALYKEPRPTAGFGEGLIQNAVGVLRKFSDEEIDFVCEKVARNRAHPVLVGMTTEKLLPIFGDLVGRMDGGRAG